MSKPQSHYGIKSITYTALRYRHAADKLQKTENVMEKYKKKLQEAADMRQQVKVFAGCPVLERAGLTSP